MSPKQFFNYTLIIALFVGIVDFFALLQFIVILNIPLKLHYLIVPTIVGSIFGSIFVLYRHYYLLAREKSVYEKLAKVDTLTGAMSRYACELIIGHETRRCARTHAPFALIMFDIDDFKQINDRFGHQTGDRVLRELCACVSGELRDMDNLCRWGGEEFVVILPETDRNQLREIAERIRHSVASHDFGLDHLLTISIGGISAHTSQVAEQLIETADKLLYQAKNSGKNRVVLIQS